MDDSTKLLVLFIFVLGIVVPFMIASGKPLLVRASASVYGLLSLTAWWVFYEVIMDLGRSPLLALMGAVLVAVLASKSWGTAFYLRKESRTSKQNGQLR